MSSWKKADLPDYPWTAVASNSTGTKLVAVNRRNEPGTKGIYVSEDSGTTWTEITSGDIDVDEWISVHMNAYGNDIIVGGNNSLFTSNDFGATWTRALYGGNDITACFGVCTNSNGTIFYVCCSNNDIYKSINSGVNWTSEQGFDEWTSIACSSSGQKVIACASNFDVGSGEVFISSDYGENWDVAPIGTWEWNSVSISSNGNVLLACRSNRIRISTDGGDSWGTLFDPPGSELVQTACSGDGNFYYAIEEDAPGIIYSGNANPLSQTTAPSGLDWRSIATNFYGTTAIAAEGNSSSGSIYIYSPIVICFKENTNILCLVDGKETEIPIQNMRKGTLVKTLKSGYLPVEIINSGTVYNSGNEERIMNRLYRLTKEKYPKLKEDLILTGGHSILLDAIKSYELRQTIIKGMRNIFKTEGKYRIFAMLDENAIPYEKQGNFVIWNFVLQNEDKNSNYGIYANGLLVESGFEASVRKM